MKIGWVDFSREDRDRVQEVLKILQEPGAVDEIGIGPVRDTFANIFFPGTSTGQTIAKYFLIVPYVLKEATEGKHGSDLTNILNEIDKEERRCGQMLIQNCPSKEGIIGRRALANNGWVARAPSSLYWSGIKRLGICKHDLSISEIIKSSLILQAQKKTLILGNRNYEAGEGGRDDEDAGKDLTVQFFSLPDDYYGENWRKNLTTDLTKTEAAFLRGKIENNVGNSLLAFLLKNNIDVEEYTSFETLCEGITEKGLAVSLPDGMGQLMKLACEFNHLVYAARVRYNYILSRGENPEAAEAWAIIESNRGSMMTVDVEKLLAALNIYNSNLRHFLQDFKKSVLAADMDAADQIIIKREIELKGPARSKLNKPASTYPEDEWIGGEYLDFRFSIAKRIISDIYKGEG